MRPVWIIRGPTWMVIGVCLLNWRSVWTYIGYLAGRDLSWWVFVMLPIAMGIFGWWGVSALYTLRHRKEWNEYRKTSTNRLRGASAPYLTRIGASRPYSRAYAYARKRTRKGSGTLVPDQVDPFVGYRAWEMYPEGTLGGPFYTHSWRVGDNASTCTSRMRSHFVGDGTCTCGFYAYKSESAMKYGCFRGNWDLAKILLDGWQVYGTIEMFGLVTEHEQGYRSSHARITGIYDTGPRARKVAERYEVPMIPLVTQAHTKTEDIIDIYLNEELE